MKKLVQWGLAVALAFLVCGAGTSQAKVKPSTADEMFTRGQHAQAIPEYKKLYETDTLKWRKAYHVTGWARALAESGQYDEADKKFQEAIKAFPEFSPAYNFYGEYLAYRGEYDKALENFKKASDIETKKIEAVKEEGEELSLRPIVNYAELLILLGKKEDGEKILRDPVDKYYAEKQPEEADMLLEIARAKALLDDYENANSVLDGINEENPGEADVLIEQGKMLLKKYNFTDAHQSFDDIEGQKKAPVRKDREAGMARVFYRLNAFGAADARIANALKIDPQYTEALVVRAWMEVVREAPENALKTMEQILKVNPKHMETLCLKGALAYVSDDTVEYGKCEKAFQALNPKSPALYKSVAELLSLNLRSAESVTFYQKAKEMDPEDAETLAGLGIQYMRVGEEQKAKDVFGPAFEKDPFNVRVINQKKLLDFLEDPKEFSTVEDKNSNLYTLKIDNEQMIVVLPYIQSFIPQVYDELSKKFNVKQADLNGKLLIEIFPKEEEFSGRVSGLPDIEGSGGACFGKVIVLLVTKEKQFNVPLVFKHELSRAMAMTRSQYRVPRWFTEGLALQMENRPVTDYDTALVFAACNGLFLPINRLNAGFNCPSYPQQTGASYAQAHFVVKYIADKFGEDKLFKFLDLYKDKKRTPEIVKTVLGIEIAQLDKDTAAYIRTIAEEATFTPLVGMPDIARLEEEANKNPKDGKTLGLLAQACYNAGDDRLKGAIEKTMAVDPENDLVNCMLGDFKLFARRPDVKGAIKHYTTALAKNPDNPLALLRMSGLLLQMRRADEAKPMFEKLLVLKPRYVGPGNPYYVLAQMAYGDALSTDTLDMKKVDEARELLEKLVQLYPSQWDAMLHLGDIYMRHKKDLKKAFGYYEGAVQTSVFNWRTHAKFSEIAKQMSKWDLVIRAIDAQLAMAEGEHELDPIELYTDAATIYRDKLKNEEKAKEYEQKAKDFETKIEQGKDPYEDTYEAE